MREVGTVVSINGNIVKLLLARGEQCESCKACETFGANAMQIEARDQIGTKVGDLVEIEVAPKHVLSHSFLVFVLITGFFLGDFVGTNEAKMSEVPGILGSFTFLIISLFIIKAYDNFWGKKNECAAHVVGFVLSEENN